MSEVKRVTVQIRRPQSDDDVGQVSHGYYVIENDVLTMTDPDGVPVRDEVTGETYVHKIKDGDNSQAIAGQLALQIRGMLRGENAPGAVKGFNRQLDYLNTGWR